MSEAPDRITAWGDKTTLGIVYKAGPCPMDGMALFPPTKYIRTDLADELADAALAALNFIENTEGELGITLGSGDKLRAALAAWEARK